MTAYAHMLTSWQMKKLKADALFGMRQYGKAVRLYQEILDDLQEETGSDGPTGLSSMFLVDFIEEFASAYGVELRHVLARSMCISCDVNSAYDPAFGENYERMNCSYINRGPSISKYGGSGGKYSTNDASAEMMAFIRKTMDENGVVWQVGELGKIDNAEIADIVVNQMELVFIISGQTVLNQCV